MATDSQTEQLILTSAREIFIKKGYAGARMQEIADHAGINKALLHYYYRSKEQLFQTILVSSFEMFAPVINKLFVEGKNLKDIITRFVDFYIDFLNEHPYLPAFMIHELTQHADKIPQMVKQLKEKPDPKRFLQMITDEVTAGKIKPVKPLHLLVNIISLCVFPLVGRPMIQSMLGVNDKEYKQFTADRKEQVASFILNAIKA